MNRRLVLFLVILVVVSGAIFLARSHFASGGKGTKVAHSPSGPAEPGQIASPEGILAYSRGLKSPLVLMNFWASWCEPCKKEMPALKDLEAKFRGQGLKIVLVSIDEEEEIDVAASYLKETGLTFPTFYKGDQPLKFVSKIFPNWSGAVPASLLLGPDMEILDSWEGDSTYEEFEQRVRQQLKGS